VVAAALLVADVLLTCGPLHYHVTSTRALAERSSRKGLRYKMRARDGVVRGHATEYLAELEPEELLNDPGPDGRYCAALQLARSGDPRALPLLIGTLSRGEPAASAFGVPWMRGVVAQQGAAHALGGYRDDRALTALLTAVEPFRRAVRAEERSLGISVVGALGRYGDARAVPALVDILYRGGDVSTGYVPNTMVLPSVEGSAVKALAQIGSRDALEALYRLARNGRSCRLLRQAANEGLAQALGSLPDGRSHRSVPRSNATRR